MCVCALGVNEGVGSIFGRSLPSQGAPARADRGAVGDDVGAGAARPHSREDSERVLQKGVDLLVQTTEI